MPAPGSRSGLALCLSGGGYRAALFHLGVVRRLNELGALGHVSAVSGVSGGSILAGFLAQHVQAWPEPGERVQDFDRLAERFRDFTRKNVRTLWVLRRLVDSGAAVENLQRNYEKHIIQLGLRELPERPSYVFNATDLNFGVDWTFRRERTGSYLAGYLDPSPDWPAAKAVAASSCFPPAFEPMRLELDPGDLRRGMAKGPHRDDLVREMYLSDGGLYDNTGLTAVEKSVAGVLVSDGGGVFNPTAPRGLLGQLMRYTAIQGNQVAAMQKRLMMRSFLGDDPLMRGVYIGIASTWEAEPGGLQYSREDVDVIARIRTDLDFFSDAEAGVLQNHGYLRAEAMMRAHGTPWIAADAPAARVPFEQWAPGRSLDALRNSHKRRLFGRWRLLHRG